MNKDLRNLTEAYNQVLEENKLASLATAATVAAGGLSNAHGQNIEDFNVNNFNKPFSVREDPKPYEGLQPEQIAKDAMDSIVKFYEKNPDKKNQPINISLLNKVALSEEYTKKLMDYLFERGKYIPPILRKKCPDYYQAILATIRNN
jgi:hypothetical protein